MFRSFLLLLIFCFCIFASDKQMNYESSLKNVVQILSNDHFTKEVENFSGTAFVDFYSDSCPPCKVLSPLFNTWSNNLVGKVKFVKVNIHKSTDIAQKFGISAVPTMLIFKNGKISEKIIGFPDIALYLEDLETKDLRVE
jgi:thioredoxin 1